MGARSLSRYAGSRPPPCAATGGAGAARRAARRHAITAVPRLPMSLTRPPEPRLVEGGIHLDALDQDLHPARPSRDAHVDGAREVDAGRLLVVAEQDLELRQVAAHLARGAALHHVAGGGVDPDVAHD